MSAAPNISRWARQQAATTGLQLHGLQLSRPWLLSLPKPLHAIRRPRRRQVSCPRHVSACNRAGGCTQVLDRRAAMTKTETSAVSATEPAARSGEHAGCVHIGLNGLYVNGRRHYTATTNRRHARLRGLRADLATSFSSPAARRCCRASGSSDESIPSSIAARRRSSLPLGSENVGEPAIAGTGKPPTVSECSSASRTGLRLLPHSRSHWLTWPICTLSRP